MSSRLSQPHLGNFHIRCQRVVCQRLRCNKTLAGRSKRSRGEARTNRDRVGQRGREIHEHEHANTHTNSSEAIERQRSLWVFFSELLATKEFMQQRH